MPGDQPKVKRWRNGGAAVWLPQRMGMRFEEAARPDTSLSPPTCSRNCANNHSDVKYLGSAAVGTRPWGEGGRGHREGRGDVAVALSTTVTPTGFPAPTCPKPCPV